MYFFTSMAKNGENFILYSGKDKIENEHLIRHAWDVDIWFHVDNLSSAHIYLRLPDGMSLDEVPSEVIMDCAQLTKANSISGCKQNNVPIVYTPASNLLKSSHMLAGQVGFKNESLCRYITVETKDNAVLNRLNKTRREEFPNLQAMKEQRESALSQERRRQQIEFRRKQKEDELKRKEEEELRSYKGVMIDSLMTSNLDLRYSGKNVDEIEDDFM
ncbi:hypothetical protein RCL1_004790 [Eukaryota sp. TZLM3-RCL]